MSTGALLLAAALAAPASAELVVSSVRAAPAFEGEGLEARADIVLSGCLAVDGVEVVRSSPTPAFRLPASGEGGYADVRILSKSLFDGVGEALASKSFRPMTCAPEAIGFIAGSARALKFSARPANVEVIFGGELSVNFGVGRGRRVLYPARRGEDGRFKRLFSILDPGLRSKVEAAILKRFEELR